MPIVRRSAPSRPVWLSVATAPPATGSAPTTVIALRPARAEFARITQPATAEDAPGQAIQRIPVYHPPAGGTRRAAGSLDPCTESVHENRSQHVGLDVAADDRRIRAAGGPRQRLGFDLVEVPIESTGDLDYTRAAAVAREHGLAVIGLRRDVARSRSDPSRREHPRQRDGVRPALHRGGVHAGLEQTSADRCTRRSAGPGRRRRTSARNTSICSSRS